MSEKDLHQIVRAEPRLVNRQPVATPRAYGGYSSAVIRFQNSATIQNADRNIRSQHRTYPSGPTHKPEELSLNLPEME